MIVFFFMNQLRGIINKKNIPGFLLTGLIGFVVYFIDNITNSNFFDGLIISLLIGIVIKNLKPDLSIFDPGAKWVGKGLLEFAVMLMGATIFLSEVLEAGATIFLVIIFAVFGGMIISYLVGHKLLGLDKKLSILVGTGNSICGNSAIAVVAPVIGASANHVSAAIGISAIIGALEILLLPLLVPALNIGDYHYGIIAGLSVYAVSQVVAASAVVSQLSASTATFVKLTRVILLGPLVIIMSLFFRNEKLGNNQDSGSNFFQSLLQYIPWFVIGFILLLIFRNFEIINNSQADLIRDISKFLFLISMVGIGLSVDVRKVVEVGPKVAVTTLSIILFLVITGISSNLIIN